MKPPINRTPIRIRLGVRKLDRDQGGHDTSRRAPRPVRAVRGTEVAARVQWVETSRQRENSAFSGNEPTSSCYFLIRHQDRTKLEAQATAALGSAVTLAVGDHVVEKQGRACSYWVIEVRETAHQQSHGGATLWQVMLGDRSPDPQTPA